MALEGQYSPRGSEALDLDRLPDELRQYRKKHGMTQVDLAKKLHVTQASISAFETGKSRTMRKDSLNKVINLIHVWRSLENVVPFGSQQTTMRAPLDAEEGEGGRRDESPAHQEDKLVQDMRRSIAEYMGGCEADYALADSMGRRELLRTYALMRRMEEGKL